MKFPKVVDVTFDVFSKADYPIRLAGGCVRDILLGKTPKDWDMCTPALPAIIIEIMEKAGWRVYDLSNGHGTVTFTYLEETVEITTLRVDAETDGRHAKVEFVEDFELDAARRDFTINAMSMDRTGKVYDYFAGQEDLESGIVRFVGDPIERMKEDYLRILRYYRFLSRFGDLKTEIDTQEAAIAHCASGLGQISGERIWSEMQQIFAADNAPDVLSKMINSGVARAIGIKRFENIS